MRNLKICKLWIETDVDTDRCWYKNYIDAALEISLEFTTVYMKKNSLLHLHTVIYNKCNR